MSEPTFSQIFGTGATRLTASNSNTGSGIFIPDTATTLSTASLTNAERWLVALAIAARAYLTATNYAANADQSLFVSDGYTSYTTRNSIKTRVDQVTINLTKSETDTTLDPNTY
jgi:hypothetical protein